MAGGGTQGNDQIRKRSMVQAYLNIKVFDVDILVDGNGGGCSNQIPNEGVGWGVGESIGGKETEGSHILILSDFAIHAIVILIHLVA